MWVGLHKPDSVPRASQPRVWSFVCQTGSPGPLPSLREGSECDYYPESSIPPKRNLRPSRPFPVLSCTTWGLSCLLPCGRSGELLPRLFTLALRSRSPVRWYVFCDTFRCLGLRRRPPRFHAARCSAVSGLSSRPHLAEAKPTSDHSGRPAQSLG